MKTRADYMNGSITHREYYSQFVNDGVKRTVLSWFSKNMLKESFEKDEHFNTKLTPIEKWDAMGGWKFSKTTGETLMKPTSAEPIEYKLIKEAGEWFSSSTTVCIYKEAARQILEEN